INVFFPCMTYHIGLGNTYGETDHSYKHPLLNLNLFIKWQNHGMNLALKDIHYPLFQVITLYTANFAIIFYTKQYPATLEISHGHHFFRQLLWANIITLKLNTRVFPISDNF